MQYIAQEKWYQVLFLRSGGCCAYREGRGNSARRKESVEMSLLNRSRVQQVKMKGVEIELKDFVGQGHWEARR